MKILDNIGRPCMILTRFTSHQLYFLEPLFRLFTQGFRISMLERIQLVIVWLHNSLRDVGSIYSKCFVSESELFTTYVDPISSSLVSDPERNTLLRWSNKKSEESDFRPDATITKLQQMKYHQDLGHGEIKVSNCNNHALTLDLLRINILAKDTLDFNKLSKAFGFQVIGFTAVFYLLSLEFNNIYTMTEIARVKLPKSINELAAFLSQKNFHSLLFISQVFWSNCTIASNQEAVIKRYHPTLKTFTDSLMQIRTNTVKVFFALRHKPLCYCVYYYYLFPFISTNICCFYPL